MKNQETFIAGSITTSDITFLIKGILWGWNILHPASRWQNLVQLKWEERTCQLHRKAEGILTTRATGGASHISSSFTLITISSAFPCNSSIPSVLFLLASVTLKVEALCSSEMSKQILATHHLNNHHCQNLQTVSAKSFRRELFKLSLWIKLFYTRSWLCLWTTCLRSTWCSKLQTGCAVDHVWV